MPITNCADIITSEDYGNFILSPSIITNDYLSMNPDSCIQKIGTIANILYQPLSLIPNFSINLIPYAVIPKLYGLMDTTALSAINAIRLQNLTTLQLKGQGTLIGFIDTGIDYMHPAFMDAVGNTRIAAIWDQNISSGQEEADTPISVPFGTVYDASDINSAIRSENPLDIVPSTDTNGHGTFLAGVSAGSDIISEDFSGVAPEAEIIAVKLKPAKQYLKDYFLIDSAAPCYQEDDIMSAVYFLIRYATLVKKPVIICIGLGSSQGAHLGNSPLSNLLNYYSQKVGCAVCLPMGNEGDSRTHFAGSIDATSEYEEVELNIGPGENSFCAELWGQSPETFSVSFSSPSGEIVPRIPARLGQSNTYAFLFDNTVLNVEYSIIEALSGRELILLRFIRPAEGIWKIRVYSRNKLSGQYNIWLPIQDFISDETYFLRPSPNITLTSPATTSYPMSVAAYNHYNNSLYISSSRGFTADGTIKPDFTAPGVNVFGPEPNGRYSTRSGTSIAAALTAGVAAQFMTWAIVQGRLPSLNGLALKNYLIRGAKREATQTYPNNTLGYGILDAFHSFDIIRED